MYMEENPEFFRRLLYFTLSSFLDEFFWRMFQTRNSYNWGNIWQGRKFCQSLAPIADSRTGGTVCKVSYSHARATGRSWVQAPAAILARLGKNYLLKSLMMTTLVLLCWVNHHEYKKSVRFNRSLHCKKCNRKQIIPTEKYISVDKKYHQ